MNVRSARLANQTEVVKPVKGGHIARDAATGRFLSVESATGISRASPKSEAAVIDASRKRSEALKRLADR